MYWKGAREVRRELLVRHGEDRRYYFERHHGTSSCVGGLSVAGRPSRAVS